MTFIPQSAPGGERSPTTRAENSPPSVGQLSRAPSICPHCWMVNPGPFRLCARCGASMETILQESGGLRRTAAVQSPVPVNGRLSLPQRIIVALFLVMLALAYLVQLLPYRHSAAPARAPHAAGR